MAGDGEATSKALTRMQEYLALPRLRHIGHTKTSPTTTSQSLFAKDAVGPNTFRSIPLREAFRADTAHTVVETLSSLNDVKTPRTRRWPTADHTMVLSATRHIFRKNARLHAFFSFPLRPLQQSLTSPCHW